MPCRAAVAVLPGFSTTVILPWGVQVANLQTSDDHQVLCCNAAQWGQVPVTGTMQGVRAMLAPTEKRIKQL